MNTVRLTPSVTVSGQPASQDFAAMAADGVGLLISNRPDGEDPGQPSAAEEAALAARHGMQFRHIPVTYASITRADVDAFADAVAEGGRVHAHCRSGPRSAVMWALARVLRDGAEPEAAMAEAARAGIDVAPVPALLARLSR